VAAPPDQFWILVAALVGWIIQRMNAAKKKADPARRQAEADAASEEERTRRVQEAVQRRIAERRGGLQPARVPVPPRPIVVLPAEPPPELEELVQVVRPVELPKPPSLAMAGPKPPVMNTPPIPLAPVHPIVEELRQPESARRAILLREILGPPIAQRAGWTNR
jgi:hypothetical protein